MSETEEGHFLVGNSSFHTGANASCLETYPFKEHSSFVARYTKFLLHYRGLVICFWLAVLGVSFWAAPLFVYNTSIGQHPLPGSPSHKARESFLAWFPRQRAQAAIQVVVTPTDGAWESGEGAPDEGVGLQDISADVARLSDSLETEIRSFQETKCPGGAEDGGLRPPLPHSFQSAAHFQALGLNQLAQAFKSNGQVVGEELIMVEYLLTSPCVYEFHSWLKSTLKELQRSSDGRRVPGGGGLKTRAVSLMYLAQDAQAAIHRDLVEIDGFSLVVALVLVARALQSGRALPLPLLSTLLSTTASFSLMLPVSIHCIQVISFAPSLMVSLCVAMSIDYSLFLISRFNEEIAKRTAMSSVHPQPGPRVNSQVLEDAISATLANTGHMVLVSGLIFMACLLSLTLAHPDMLLVSCGVGGACSVLCCLAVNLTLLPPLLPFCMSPLPVSARVPSPSLPPPSSPSSSPSPVTVHISAASQSLSPPTPQQDNTASSSSTAVDINSCGRVGMPSGAGPEISTTGLSSDVELASNHLSSGTPAPSHSRLVPLKPMRPPGCSDSCAAESDIQHEQKEEEEEDLDQMVLLEEFQANEDSGQEIDKRWLRFAEFTVKYYRFLGPVVFALILAPAIFFLGDFSVNYSFLNVVPRGCESALAMQSLEEGWGQGQMLPYRLIFRSTGNTSVISREFFDEAQKVISALQDMESYPPPRISGLLWFETKPSSFALVQAMLPHRCGVDKGHCRCPGPLSPLSERICTVQLARQRFVSADERSTFVSVVVSIPPGSSRGRQWLRDARRLLRHIQQDGVNLGGGVEVQLEIHLDGEMAVMMDLVSAAFSKGVFLTTAAAAIAFLFQVVALQSVALGVITVLTIALSLAAVFSLAAAVYGPQALLQPIGVAALNPSDGLFWGVPVLAGALVLGLGVDYNVFLLTRVVELRKKGYSDPDAIALGLAKTGPIITAGGMIMMVAFGSLLFSSLMVLNQFGLILSLAVVLDTFIIRTLLVPAMMASAGNLVFWPQRMPHAKHGHKLLLLNSDQS